MGASRVCSCTDLQHLMSKAGYVAMLLQLPGKASGSEEEFVSAKRCLLTVANMLHLTLTEAVLMLG